MIKVETSSNLIHRFDNVISVELCNKLIKFMDENITLKENFDKNEVPWSDNENINYINIDKDLQSEVNDYKETLTNLISNCYKITLYPHFTDLVLWRAGRKMQPHKDNGGIEYPHLWCRHVSAVTYLNDNFAGGETIIKNEHDDNYISHPKQGSVAIFASDDRCIHSVNEIISGNRYTMPMWFTLDKNYCEPK